MKFRIIGILFMILGVFAISYPKLQSYYYIDKQEKILEQWKGDLSSLEVTNNIESDIIEDNMQISSSENVDGTLKIDSIGFYQPILKGATQENLNLSITKIDNTSCVGEIGNYVIAGHNSRTYGRNFNRLHEVDIGDEIQLNDGTSDYKYYVYDKFIVASNEVWVLEEEKNRSIVTLITCDYSTDPSSRLIIRGEMKP